MRKYIGKGEVFSFNGKIVEAFEHGAERIEWSRIFMNMVGRCWKER